MASEAYIEIYFFPFVGGGHQIPMIDMARVFASHGAKATLIAAPTNALNFQNAVVRDQLSGHPITIHVLPLPDGAPQPDPEMSAGPFTDTSALETPLKLLLVQSPPDCIVVDAFHRWAPQVIDELGVKRVVFSGNGCFSRCVGENLRRFSPHEDVGSDSEPFSVPGLPDRVELTRSQLPSFVRQMTRFPDRMGKAEETSFGVLVNSFHCGWNSTLEGVSAGVPMMTWPMSAEQFFNEKLVTDVLRIGVQVGSKEWTSWNEEKKTLVGRERVEMAVKRLMGGSEEAAEMRRRARELKEKAKRAVEEGGSSYSGVDALISELKSCRAEN